MGRYVLRRLASAVVTLWVLATIVFLMVNVLPGNVGRRVLGPFALEDDVVRFNPASQRIAGMHGFEILLTLAS